MSSHILYCYPVVLQDDNSDDTKCKENIKRWCNDKCVDFKNNINVNTVDKLLHMFETDSALNNDFINDIVDNIGIILTEAAKHHLVLHIWRLKVKVKLAWSKPWFNDEC